LSAAWDKLRGFKPNKKKLQIGAAAAFVVLILVIYFSTLFGTDKTNPSGGGNGNAAAILTAAEYRDRVQSEVESFLSGISGAGRVKALINFESTPELIIAYTVSGSSNKSPSGETTQSTQTPVILNQNGEQIPLVLKQTFPKVNGVIVGAEGANDVKVKLAIIDALRTYFALSASSVQVYALKPS
jgi:stage III sporulation protein AG